jgi:D-beta-D-heptose 7-phosphate kinase/D-beta-D-heptose 1-phosphate adenosyltransferase
LYTKNLKRFHNVISRFKDARILVLGDIMLDRFIWGTVSRISPEAPVPVVWSKSESFMPGGASNVANNLKALGSDVHMCGVVGQDEAGDIVIDELSKNGIASDGIIRDNTRPTVQKSRIIAHHQQVVRIDKEADKPVSKRIISKMLSFSESVIKDMDAVIIEDYSKGVVVPSLIKGILRIAKKNKKIVMVDPKEEHLKLYRSVTAITPNRKEAEVTSGIKIKDKQSLKEAGKRMLNILGCEAVLITLGEDGIAVFKRNKSMVHIPTVAQEVYDVSGAGDTVVGALTLARVCGASMVEAAHIANVAAGVVVGKVGIGICTADELKSHLRQIKESGIHNTPARSKLGRSVPDAFISESIFRPSGTGNIKPRSS